MDRISGANFITVAGKRQFQDLNLAANQLGTELVAVWHTGAQESILAPVEDIGLVPTDADNTQLLQAMRLYAGANLQTITATPANPLTIQNAGIVFVNAAAGNVVITLPAAAAANGRPFGFRFVRTDSSANTVSVALHAGDTTLFGGLAGPFSIGAFGRLTLWSDGTTHWVVEPVSGRQVFTASGTFTVPVGVTVLRRVEVWGGGGGGGGAAVAAAGTGGGGAGYARSSFIVVTPGSAITVTIGAGGSGGAATGTNGTAGGTSSFGAYLTATGGGAGVGSASGAANVSAGGGSGSGGTDFNLAGQPSLNAFQTGSWYAGSGGGAAYGGSLTEITVSSAPVSPFPGNGGSGGAQGWVGTSGANGLVLVEW